jgi:YggT family protein
LRENCGEWRHLGPALWAVKDAKAAQNRRLRGASRRPLFLGLASGYSSSAQRMERSMNPFLWLVDTIITIYIWILIAAAVLSWLIAFNVVNMRNQIVAGVAEFLYRVTEPALRPIRNLLPNLGGIDVSPVILIIGLLFLRQFIFWLYIKMFV